MWSHFDQTVDNKPIPSLQSLIDKDAAFQPDTPSMALGPHVSGPNPRASLSSWADDTDPFSALDPAGVTPEPHVPKLNLAIISHLNPNIGAGASVANATTIISDGSGIPDSPSPLPAGLPEISGIPNNNNTPMNVDGNTGSIDAAQGSNVDPLLPRSPPVEEYKETIGEASIMLQECGDWICIFPVNKGKYTPSGVIVDKLAYLLMAIHDGGWEHTIIEDSSIIEGYVPKDVTNFTLKQLMDKLFFPERPPYIKKKKGKGKVKEFVPSSQPLENQDVEMISTEGVKPTKPTQAKPTPKHTPPKLPIKAAFPPPPLPPTPKDTSKINSDFICMHSAPTSPIPPVELKLFDRTSNTYITELAHIPTVFPSGEPMNLDLYITWLDSSCAVVLRHNWLACYNPLIDWASSNTTASSSVLSWTVPANAPVHTSVDTPPISTLDSPSSTANIPQPSISLINATAFLHTSCLPGSCNFHLGLSAISATTGASQVSNTPVNLSNMPNKYYEFTNIFSKAWADTLTPH
ncbi:hypothetical protein AN958_12686 [Leucoagaricus sp. SymC.cos]|nr:hypothetical protein AN958_12686 [Leucoagaricus sp. SymC.cos]